MCFYLKLRNFGPLCNPMCMYWLCESVHVFFTLFPSTQTLIKLPLHYKRLLCGQLWKDHSSACQRGQRPFDLGSLLYMCMSMCVFVCLRGQSRFSHLASAESVHSKHDLNPSKSNQPLHCPKGPAETHHGNSSTELPLPIILQLP